MIIPRVLAEFGPYNAEQELREQYPNASGSAPDETLAKILPEATEWVKIGEH